MLFVRADCLNCPKDLQVKALDIGYHVFEVVEHPDGSAFVKCADNKFEPLPENIEALPALVRGNHIFIGETPIRNFLRTQA